MIRQLAILAVAAICLTASATAEPETFAERQLLVEKLSAFFYAKGPAPEGIKTIDFCAIGFNYENYDAEWKSALENFCKSYNSGMLPLGHLFSKLDKHHILEAKLFFKVFYFAPTIVDFVNFAYWARPLVNEYVFDYCFALAIIHRSDTETIHLKPHYQIHPGYYFNNDVMQQVYDFKMNFDHHGEDKPDSHFVTAKYSNWYSSPSFGDDFNATYFKEDIDLNTFFNNFEMRYPSWMSSEEFPNAKLAWRGESYYYTMKMLLNRDYMERLCHGYGEVEHLDLSKPIPIGYTPYMTYKNGFFFPARAGQTPIPSWMNEYSQQAGDFEQRIAAATDLGYIMMPNASYVKMPFKEAIEWLGSIIQGNAASVNGHFYGKLDVYYRRMLGFMPKPYSRYHLLPSALEQSATTLKDPMFWPMNKKIMGYFERYFAKLGPYAEHEMAFPGVHLKSMNLTGHLYTFFEKKNTLIEKFRHTKEGSTPQYTSIYGSHERINHTPYTLTFFIHSDKPVNASLRVFMVPRFNEFGERFNDHYKHSILLDSFWHELHEGENTLTRNSDEFTWISPSYKKPTTFEHIPVGEEKAAFFKHRYGFPDSLSLPIGKPEGWECEFFAIVNEYIPDQSRPVPLIGIWDDKPLDFPTNRPWFSPSLPNMYSLYEKIYHRDESAVNRSTE